LQAIYRPDTITRSQEQAAVLAFIYLVPCISIVVLLTGSSKSVLFFSVVAVTID
jgi:hypothetical protein